MHTSDNLLQKHPSIGWTVHMLRKRASMTLNDLAVRAGISVSAVSKIENGQTSPTYDTILRLAVGLGVDIAVLFGSEVQGTVNGRRVITRAGAGIVQSTPHYDYEMLCSDLATKAFTPLLTQVRARSVDEFAGGLQGHEGEEFFFVINGAVTLYTEHYAPALLMQGDSAYFDSGMAHALVSSSKEDAVILWIATRVHGVLDANHLPSGESLTSSAGVPGENITARQPAGAIRRGHPG